MATDGDNRRHSLVSPKVTALRQEHAAPRMSIERSTTYTMKAERDDLKEAAEQSLNVILDLALDGTIRWVSSSWTDVVGTPVESVKDKSIADVVVSNKGVFADAIESMKKDDSKSRIIRFQVRVGDLSVLKHGANTEGQSEEELVTEDREAGGEEQVLSLEGQGIMVYDRSSDDDTHVGCNPRIHLRYFD